MRILLTTDGSDHSRIAEELLAKSPLWKKAHVVVVAVAPGPSLWPHTPLTGAAIDSDLDEAYAYAHTQTRDAAENAHRRLLDAGFEASFEILDGEPGPAILDYVEHHEIDLVAVGSRGRGSLASLLLGSVARKLVNYSPVSVLVARAGHDTPAARIEHIRATAKLNALVAFDDSVGSRAAVESLKSHGPKAFAKAVAFCAEPLALMPPGVDPLNVAEVYRADHDRAVAIAKRGAQDLAEFADEALYDTELGRPGEAICEAAGKLAADLIFVGATRHGAVERFLLGSVAYEIATSAPCSVLIVRPR